MSIHIYIAYFVNTAIWMYFWHQDIDMFSKHHNWSFGEEKIVLAPVLPWFTEIYLSQIQMWNCIFVLVWHQCQDQNWEWIQVLDLKFSFKVYFNFDHVWSAQVTVSCVMLLWSPASPMSPMSLTDTLRLTVLSLPSLLTILTSILRFQCVLNTFWTSSFAKP